MNNFNSTKVKVVVFPLLFLFSVVSTNAQNIEKHYTSSTDEEGTLYFITPREGFKDGKDKLIYDLTHKTNKDSINLNFTFLNKNIYEIKNLTLSSSGKKISSPVKKLFIETKKKKWKHRYSSKFSYSDLSDFFKGNSPDISVTGPNKKKSFTIKEKNWKKQSDIVVKIFTLINLNRKEK